MTITSLVVLWQRIQTVSWAASDRIFDLEEAQRDFTSFLISYEGRSMKIREGQVFVSGAQLQNSRQ